MTAENKIRILKLLIIIALNLCIIALIAYLRDAFPDLGHSAYIILPDVLPGF